MLAESNDCNSHQTTGDSNVCIYTYMYIHRYIHTKTYIYNKREGIEANNRSRQDWAQKQEIQRGKGGRRRHHEELERKSSWRRLSNRHELWRNRLECSRLLRSCRSLSSLSLSLPSSNGSGEMTETKGGKTVPKRMVTGSPEKKNGPVMTKPARKRHLSAWISARVWTATDLNESELIYSRLKNSKPVCIWCGFDFRQANRQSTLAELLFLFSFCRKH